MKKPLVPGSFAAWGRTVSRKLTFFEEATCPGQLRCLGQNFFSKYDIFLNTPLVPGSFAAWGRTVSQNMIVFLNKPLVPGSFAAWGRTFARKSIFSQKPLVPGSLAAWGSFFQKIYIFLKKPLVPGSFAAWGKTFYQKTSFQELWDSCAQSEASEIPNNGLSGILGLLFA